MTNPSTTSRYRLSVPLSDESLKIYSELPRVSGKSLGAVLSDWLHDTCSTAQMTVRQMEAIRREPEAAMERLEALAERAEYLAEQAMERATSGEDFDLDDKGGPLAGKLSPRSKLGAKGGLTPPSSNTGGKVGKTLKSVRVQK